MTDAFPVTVQHAFILPREDWTNPVVWQEGMFLRTQHWQQQDRWTEQIVRGWVGSLRPNAWGLIGYAVNRDLLATGRFALGSAAGVFDDGTPLAGLVTELAGILHQRGEALAARLTPSGQSGVAQVQDFLLLRSINGWQNVLAHWADTGNVHPESLFITLVQMAGEFATYRHDDLQRSFAPVVSDLRRALATVLGQTAIAIPLHEARHGVRVGPISDRTILRAAGFVLTVQCDMPAETLRRASPHGQPMPNSGGLAIHMSGDRPNARPELWAIQG